MDYTGLENVISNKGVRKPIQVDVDEDGVLVSEANDNRNVVVIYNNGPDTAWGNNTLATATSEEGFPLLVGSAIVDSDTIDAWYFATDTGETADIRGWEVERS